MSGCKMGTWPAYARAFSSPALKPGKRPWERGWRNNYMLKCDHFLFLPPPPPSHPLKEILFFMAMHCNQELRFSSWLKIHILFRNLNTQVYIRETVADLEEAPPHLFKSRPPPPPSPLLSWRSGSATVTDISNNNNNNFMNGWEMSRKTSAKQTNTKTQRSRTNRLSKAYKDARRPSSERQFKRQWQQRQWQRWLENNFKGELRISREFRFIYSSNGINIPNTICKTASIFENKILNIARCSSRFLGYCLISNREGLGTSL